MCADFFIFLYTNVRFVYDVRVVDDAICMLVTRVCVCVCPRRMPALLHAPGCNLVEL